MEPWEENEELFHRWLHHELTEEEKNALKDSDARKEYENILIASQALKKPTYNVNAEYQKLQARIKRRPKTKVIPWRKTIISSLVAASLVIAFISYYFFFQGLTSLHTGNGEQMVFWLPDSSKVTLNANSALSYSPDHYTEKRELQLEGEGFFEVKKGNLFRVQTSQGIVTVLGTSFNVKNRGEELEVACFTGAVKVSQKNIHEKLDAGQHLKLRKGNIVDQDNLPGKMPVWVSGETKLENVSVQTALKELQYLYGLEITSNNLPDKKYTGTFPNDDVETAVKLVLDPLGIPYTLDEPHRKLELH